jgi:hypothetical protein
MAFVTHAERGVLRILLRAGGRHTFRPDANDQIAYRTFDRDVIRILYLLRSKGLVSIDEGASHLISLAGQGDGKFASITAELTNAGREALQA